MSNLFDQPAVNWAIHGDVTDVGAQWSVPIEGNFSANTNGRITYVYPDVAPAGDTLVGIISYTITAIEGDIWFVVMPDGAGGQFSQKLASYGDAVPLSGTIDLLVAIPEGASTVELGTYNQQTAPANGPPPEGYGSLGALLVPAPPTTPPSCFWTDLNQCKQDCGDALALTKLPQSVFIPAVPAQDHRDASITCPPPPHVPRWFTKTLCGTVTHYLLLSGTQVVGYSHAYLINYNGKVVLEKEAIEMIVQGATADHSQLLYAEPFCTQVKVYE